MHITHWVPSSGAPPAWPCVKSWINLELPDGAGKTFVQSLAGSVKHVWNKVVREFLESKSDWLFSTHHDVTFDPQTLKRLLSWDKPLVSALIFMRHSPTVPHVWKQYDNFEEYYAHRITDTREWFYRHPDYIRFGPFVMDPKPEDALFKISFTSTACTIIHRSVFEKMREFVHDEWFVCDSEISGGGEDRRFFQYATLAGIDGYVDRSCIAGHIAGDIATGAADFIAWDSVSTWRNTGERDAKGLEATTWTENVSDNP